MKEIEIELNGVKIKAQENENLLELSLKHGKYIPHFCYHKKLSIAANCRMCLVEVEKAPKPIPACATKVVDGMKVFTNSKIAVDAQKGVMEFLLINHPLDCPICDQGGECQLQDLALDYGKDATRFEEEKRVVKDENLGSLIQTNMTRCIHCSRCIRFTDEIAGYQELGMYYRNNHVRVMSFLEKSIDSEISGNVIDLCPVGALTSKPFQFKARNWELSRRKSISSHDSLGSNLLVNVDKYYKVMRVLPLENENINECWLSDRDRFAYTGLYHQDRVAAPLIKQDGKWQTVSWETAIEYTARTIYQVIQEQGKENIGVIANPSSTLEELYLLQRLMLTLGIENLDHRINQQDFSCDQEKIVNYLGAGIVNLASSDHILLLATNLRQEQPLLTQRLRQAAKKQTTIDNIAIFDEKLFLNLSNNLVVDINQLPQLLLNLLITISKLTGKKSELIDISAFNKEDIALENLNSEQLKLLANNLLKENTHIVFGNIIESLENYSSILLIIQEIAHLSGAKISIIPNKANSVGASVLEFLPQGKHYFNQQDITTEIVGINRNFIEHAKNGLNIQQMLEKQLKSYILFNVELEKEHPNPELVLKSLNNALSVIVFATHTNSHMLKYADIILPIATSYETAGTFINCEGTIQPFNGSTRPYELARPGWKLLRVLANQFGFANFIQDDINQVREEMAETMDSYRDRLFSEISIDPKNCQKIFAQINKSLIKDSPQIDKKLKLLSINNIYNKDSTVRRAIPLQDTVLAEQWCMVGENLAKKYNLSADQSTSIRCISVNGTIQDISVLVKISNNMPNNYIFLSKKSDDDIVNMQGTVEFNFS